jgi:AraC family transcriptional regulator
VREYVEQHFTEKLHTETLAQIAALSVGHFNRAFRQSTGSPPHRHITERRIQIAIELVQKTSRALADIALDVGFADQSHFSRTYVAVTGETPSACRRRHR